MKATPWPGFRRLHPGFGRRQGRCRVGQPSQPGNHPVDDAGDLFAARQPKRRSAVWGVLPAYCANRSLASRVRRLVRRLMDGASRFQQCQ